MSTAAMLVYPDFFKVAVSESGNHENNIYNNTWSEKHHGIKEIDDAGRQREVRVSASRRTPSSRRTSRAI